MKKNVLDVGQCDLDHSNLSELIGSHFDCNVVRSNSLKETQELMQSGGFDLVLVNRILDHDGASGMDVIRHVRRSSPETPVMLVSNFPEAQSESVELGAEPGFGKASLGDSRTIQLLQPFLG